MNIREIREAARESDHLTFSFDRFVLDVDRGALLKDGAEVSLRPKSFDVLVCLVTHRGTLLSREELMHQVWGSVVVTEDSLTQCLIEIRKVLGDCEKTMVRTVRGRGFRFEIPVDVHEPREPVFTHTTSRRLFSLRRPSAWSMAVMLFLTIAMAATWWRSGTLESPGDPLADASTGPPVGTSSAGYNHYLSGKHFHHRRSDGDLERAISEFEKALKADPELADALVGLAGSVRVKSWEDGAPFESISKRYRSLLLQALEIDPQHAEAHARLTAFYRFKGDETLTVFHWNQAIEYGQDDTTVLSMAAGVAYDRFDFELAYELIDRALELDPLSALNRNNQAWYLYGGGRYQDARVAFEIAANLNPDLSVDIQGRLMRISLLLGEMERAAELAYTLPQGKERDSGLAIALGALGQHEQAELALQSLKARDGAGAAEELAGYYAFQGDFDQAFYWLDRATSASLLKMDRMHALGFYQDISHSPMLKNLHLDPRWAEWGGRFEGVYPGTGGLRLAVGGD